VPYQTKDRKKLMKKLFILLSSVVLIAGCHSRDASRGGSYYDETGNVTEPATTPSTTQPSDNDTTKGSDGQALNDPSKNTGNDPSSTSTNTPDNNPSQPSNP
jgi:hypothetical protein